MPDPQIPEIDVAEAQRRLDAGAALLDVREPDEWGAGHAAGAQWIPMGELVARQGEVPGDRPVVVVCRVGGRSGKVTQALVQAGFEAVNLGGGMQAWEAAGLPVVTDDGGAGTVL